MCVVLCFPRLTEILNYVRKHTHGSQTSEYSPAHIANTLQWLRLWTQTARVRTAVSHCIHHGSKYSLRTRARVIENELKAI